MRSVLILVLLLLTPATYANQTLEAADTLFQAQHYSDAVLEYKRYLYLNPEGEQREWAHYRIGLSYYEAQEFRLANQAWHRLLTEHADSSLRPQVELMMGKSSLRLAEYAESSRVLYPLANQTDSPPTVQEARFLLAWCQAYQHNWYAAITEFRQAAKVDNGSRQLAELSTRLADMALMWEAETHRSVQFARRLSTVIPGAGQIYSGQIAQGGLTMAVAGGLVYLLADAIGKKRPVDAVALSLIGIRLHWYNIGRAGQSAQKYNQQRDSQLLSALQEIGGDIDTTVQSVSKPIQ